jgi:hypothetical protein
VASVPVAIWPREPHGGDRAEPDGARVLQAGLERCGETRSRRLRNGSRASTLVSAWASAEPNISPPEVEAQAPTAMFPVRSASHAWRNASCHGLSSPLQIRAAAAAGLAGWRATA